jgi:transcriptional regulator with XRE-family HTH domain
MRIRTIGQWVRAAREHAGWTQTELARELRVTEGNISHWERQMHNPSHEQVMRIRQLTRYPLDEEGAPVDWPFPDLQPASFDNLPPPWLDVAQQLLQVVLSNSPTEAEDSSPAPHTKVRA